MKRILLAAIFCCSFLSLLANHITGGEMSYQVVGRNGNDYTYRVTLKLYRDCNSTGAPLDQQAAISIYDNGSGQRRDFPTQLRTPITVLNLTSPGPCIQNPPIVCYQVGYYTFDAVLPANSQGYTITYQRCCRIIGINNLTSPSSSIGATYTAQIPGTSPVASGPLNNSATFVGADTVIVCAFNNFCYDFGAVDAPVTLPGNNIPADSLAYSFCGAYLGGSTGQAMPNPPGPPPYANVPYLDPYAANQPLGANVTLNPNTGLLCGIAPPPGIYVVTVCVTEYRNGVAIATQRKDLQIKVGDCNVAQAVPAVFDPIRGIIVEPTSAGCSGYTYDFINNTQANPLIRTYYWEFSDGATYNVANPTHTFADTGLYTIKLVINRGEDCSDSATTTLRVYPGFFPGFVFTGFCATKPTQFTDTSKTRYGFINSWRWDFGQIGTENDTSRLQNPVYTYPNTGTKSVRFIVTSNKGCIDTVTKDITILDRPPLTLLTKDTLMCVGDTIQLGASGNGTFSWTPNTNIINPNSPTPLVHPISTTNYFVQLDENGCIARDTVRVRVVSFVTLQAMPDTTICLTDSARLRVNSDGLRFQWTPTATIVSNPTDKNPFVRPGPGTTNYVVTARIGRCISTDDVNVTTIPYPIANAGPDLTLCFNTSGPINASIVGNRFVWSPTQGLSDPASLNPVAAPRSTTRYILSAFDDLGCPKPGRDTVVVTILPEVIAFAGNDTSVVINQPLQFNAMGGEQYSWTPATNLNRTDVFNPVGVYTGNFDSITYYVTVADANNCTDVDSIRVKVFRTNPQVFVPSAFTPNGDGRNDIFRPLAVGFTKLDYFRVYNRWGQLVFETQTNERGWDGRINGQQQGSNTYVWVVKGTDYTGKVVTAKGTVTLIR